MTAQLSLIEQAASVKARITEATFQAYKQSMDQLKMLYNQERAEFSGNPYKLERKYSYARKKIYYKHFNVFTTGNLEKYPFLEQFKEMVDKALDGFAWKEYIERVKRYVSPNPEIDGLIEVYLEKSENYIKEAVLAREYRGRAESDVHAQLARRYRKIRINSVLQYLAAFSPAPGTDENKNLRRALKSIRKLLTCYRDKDLHPEGLTELEKLSFHKYSMIYNRILLSDSKNNPLEDSIDKVRKIFQLHQKECIRLIARIREDRRQQAA